MKSCFKIIGCCIAILALANCGRGSSRKLEPAPRHVVVEIDAKTLSSDDVKAINALLGRATVVELPSIKPPDFLMIGGDESAEAVKHLYSVWLNDGFIYPGDWLTARTKVLEDKSVECLQIDGADVRTLKNVWETYRSR